MPERCGRPQWERRIRPANGKARAKTTGAALAFGCRTGIGLCVCIGQRVGVRSMSVRRRVMFMPVMFMRRRRAGVRAVMTEGAAGLDRCREAAVHELLDVTSAGH